MSNDKEDRTPTPMEMRMIELVIQRKTNKEMGHELGVRPDTISHRLSQLYKDTGCKNRAGLVDLAHRKGWVK